MSRSLHTGVTKRRPKNRVAAERASANLAGTPLAVPELNPARFDIIPVRELPKTRRKPGQPKLPAIARNGPLLRLPGKEMLTQQRHLPPAAQPGVTALQAFLQTRTHGISEGMADLVTADDHSDDGHVVQWNMSDPLLSRHHRRRIAQHNSWERIIYTERMYKIYLAHKHAGAAYLHAGVPAGMSTCSCASKRRIKITFIDLSGPTPSTVDTCGCTSVAERVLPLGYFPCAPRAPSLAFSTSLLDLISIHSLHVAPNTTAWARTLESFWARRGPVKRATGSLRKRLGMALTWYQVLDNRAEDFVTQSLPDLTARKRPRHVLEDDTAADARRAKHPRLATVGLDSSGADSAESAATATIAAQTNASCAGNLAGGRRQDGAEFTARGPVQQDSGIQDDGRDGDDVPDGLDSDSTPGPSVAHARGEVEDAHGLGARATPRAGGRARNARGTQASNGAESNKTPKRTKPRADGEHESNTGTADDLQRPSPRLRRICPLCFGGDRPSLARSIAHILVCLDANFAQKRRKSTKKDSKMSFAGGRFAEDDFVAAMEAEVAAQRKRPARKQRQGHEAQVSDDVLDECEQSFIAAQENVTKAAKNYYADTGLMALLCRHDRVLFLANLTTPGERQHYALALLRKLALELPRTWQIGVLYDIACQVSRSIAKWGLVPELDGRLSFAVSVFHAYGHQWECQIVFHPRKRDGFGLTDGEGCERFWSSIRHLIAGLRVSGYHRRLFVLDRQVHAQDHEGMWNFASWLRKRYKNAQTRLVDAQSILDTCGETDDELEKQWKAQVSAQLVKHRQSKSAADKILDKILEGLGTIDGLKQDLADDRKRLRKARKLSATEAHSISIRIDNTRQEIESLQNKVDTLQGSLGTEQCRRLEEMRGSEYLRARVNARALRANIRQTLVAHKFEHRKLERAYRHQLMQAKEHAQTKDLIHRRERNISAQVTKFNKLVDRMVLLARDGYKPRGRIVMPRKLESKRLFKLDVDDDIWQEDPGLGPQDEEQLPRYIADPNVQRGMTALLEKRRCLEEMERLQAEALALRRWWDEEENVLRSVCEGPNDDPSIRLAVQRRYDLHRCLRTTFEHDLAYCTLGEQFMQVPATCSPLAAQSISYGREHGKASTDGNGEDQESTVVDDASDDASDAYSDREDEDEPEADWLDGLESAQRSDHDISDTEVDGEHDEDGADSSAEDIGEVEDVVAGPSISKITRPSTSTSVMAVRAPSIPVPTSSAMPPSSSGIRTKKKKARPETRIRYVAGSYSCMDHDLDRIAERRTWLSGDGLSTFLESERERLGVTDASIVHSRTLFDVQIYESNRKNGNTEAAAANMEDILSALTQLVDARSGRKWLILGHVEVPAHWTLIEILWPERRIRFYDSRSQKSGYASVLEKKTRLLLKLYEERVVADLDVETFTWEGEKRRIRQFNGYDCGPFVAADASSLLSSDSPSALTQDDMESWRRTMERRVRALRVVEKIDYAKSKAENTAVDVIEISD